MLEMVEPGEPVRLALAVGGFEFEDLRVPRQGDAWPRLRGTGLCPFRQLPVLEVGDVVVSQSNAVLRYAVLLTGLYPVEDPLRAGKVDEVLGVIQDVKVRMMPSLIEQADRGFCVGDRYGSRRLALRRFQTFHQVVRLRPG